MNFRCLAHAGVKITGQGSTIPVAPDTGALVRPGVGVLTGQGTNVDANADGKSICVLIPTKYPIKV